MHDGGVEPPRGGLGSATAAVVWRQTPCGGPTPPPCMAGCSGFAPPCMVAGPNGLLIIFFSNRPKFGICFKFGLKIKKSPWLGSGRAKRPAPLKQACKSKYYSGL